MIEVHPLKKMSLFEKMKYEKSVASLYEEVKEILNKSDVYIEGKEMEPEMTWENGEVLLMRRYGVYKDRLTIHLTLYLDTEIHWELKQGLTSGYIELKSPNALTHGKNRNIERFENKEDMEKVLKKMLTVYSLKKLFEREGLLFLEQTKSKIQEHCMFLGLEIDEQKIEQELMKVFKTTTLGELEIELFNYEKMTNLGSHNGVTLYNTMNGRKKKIRYEKITK